MYGSNRILSHAVQQPGIGERSMYVWRCFGEYLRAVSEQQVESAVWKASSNASAKQREAEEGAVR